MRALRTGFIERGTIGRIGKIGRIRNLRNLGNGISNLLKFIKFTKLLIIYHLNQRTNFLLEGIRYNARRISRRWAVLEVLPIDEIIR